IYHVSHDGSKSTVEPMTANQSAREALADMGYKASDLFLANGIIWVEGPSDRTYLNWWLSLMAPDLVEGIHYAIMFVGGREQFENLDWLDKPGSSEAKALNLNPNVYAVIDSDRTSDSSPPSDTALLLERILGPDRCWITAGYETENYLP